MPEHEIFAGCWPSVCFWHLLHSGLDAVESCTMHLLCRTKLAINYLQGDDCACANDSAELGDSSNEFPRNVSLEA